jgi:hypothetical protein
MEIIRKKICLEDFTSRIPSKRLNFIGKTPDNTSWGKIVDNFHFGDEKEFRYSYIMNLYYEIIKLLKNCKVYKIKESTPYQRYLSFEKKWSDYLYYYSNGYKLISLSKPDGIDETDIKIETNLPISKTNDYIKITKNGISFYFKWCTNNFKSTHFISNEIIKLDSAPNLTEKQNEYDYFVYNDVFYYWVYEKSEYTRLDGDFVIVLNTDNLQFVKNEVKRIIGNENLFQFIDEVNEKIGKYITPSFIFDNITPLFFYDCDLDISNKDGLLYKLTELSEHIRENTLNDITFKHYGGKVFFEYLNLIKEISYKALGEKNV